MVLIFRNQKYISNRNFFPLSDHYLIQIRIKSGTFLPWKYHQCRVNLWNLGLWRHAPYISEQVFISYPYLRCEELTISNLSFVHNVHEDLIQVFIDLIGFTLDEISNFVISRHCCGVSFWSKRWAKWAAKVSEFYRAVLFAPHLGNVGPFFWVFLMLPT